MQASLAFFNKLALSVDCIYAFMSANFQFADIEGQTIIFHSVAELSHTVGEL